MLSVVFVLSAVRVITSPKRKRERDIGAGDFSITTAAQS